MAERDVTWGLALLWRRKWLIGVALVVAGVAAFAFSLFLPKAYRARALVVVAEPKVQSGEGIESPGLDQARLYAETYAELFRRVVPGGAIEGVGAVDEALAREIRGGVAVRAVPGTLLLEVTFDSATPERAAQVLTAHVERVAAVSRELTDSDVAGARGYLEQVVAASRQQFEEAERALREYRSTARTEELKERLKQVLEQTGELDTEAKETAWTASELQGGVASLETSLGAQPKVLGLTDSVADQPKASAVLEAAGVKPESLLGLQLRREVLNPAYEESAPELIVRTADLAAARAKGDTLRAQLRQNTADAVALQRQLAERELELEARELRYTIAKGTYEAASKRLENAQLAVRARTPQIRVVAGAVSDPQPVRPRPLFNALVAAFAAFLLAAFAILLADQVAPASGAGRVQE